MIPFILGGVALAATGYGVAKLLEEDCNCNKKSESYFVDLDNENHEAQEDKLLERFELAKMELYNTSVMELKTALNKIRNLDKEISITNLELEKTIYPYEKLTDEIKQKLVKYTNILQKIKEYIDDRLDTLSSIISQSNYEKYSSDDKTLVDNLIRLITLIDKVSHSKTTKDNIDISIKVQKLFSKIEKIIK